MADIEIVVKLSEKDVECLKRLGALWIQSENGAAIVSKALLEGTILPRGHSNLFDERDIVRGNYEIIGHRIYELDPVLEADNTKGEE